MVSAEWWDEDEDDGPRDDGYTRFAAWAARGPTLDERLARCRPSWFDQAACRGLDPEMFYPHPGEPAEQAKAVCAGCGVRDACAELAAARGERFGIWGGQGRNERHGAGSVSGSPWSQNGHRKATT